MISRRETDSKDTPQPQPLHRIAQIRREKGLKLSVIARQMGCTVAELRQQENGARDLQITELMEWQRILDVPLYELIIDPTLPPEPEQEQLAKLLETAAALRGCSRSVAEQAFAEMLVEQLTGMLGKYAQQAQARTEGD